MAAVREPTSAAVRSVFGKMKEFKALLFKLYYLPCGLDRWYSLSLLKKPIKAHIPLSLCIYRELKKKLDHSLSFCRHLLSPLHHLFFDIMSLKWFQIDSKWISLWGEQTEIETITISQIKGNHRTRFFKVPWQHKTEFRKFDENMGQREPDYAVDDLFLLWWQHQRLIACSLT